MAIAIEKAGYPVRTFDDARKALEFLDEATSPQLAICDLRMPGLDGLGFLQEVRARALDSRSSWSPASGSIESAVEAMRVGADGLPDQAGRPLRAAQEGHDPAREAPARGEGRPSSIASSTSASVSSRSSAGRPSMEALFEQMKLVAPTRSKVLVIGESGTGKELVANAIHRASPGGTSDSWQSTAARSVGHPRERALRPRARLVHRRHRGARSASSSWRTRHALPRRDLGALSRAPGQAAARARGPAHHAGGWRRPDRGRLPPDRGHQQGSRARDRRRRFARISTTGSRW